MHMQSSVFESLRSNYIGTNLKHQASGVREPFSMASNMQSKQEKHSFYPLNMKELPEKFIKKAEVELGETPERREKCLIELRKRILEETDFTCRTDDEFLIMLLRSRKFDHERAFTTMQNMYKMKLEIRFFRRLQHINQIYDVLESRVLTFLQYRDQEGRAIYIHKMSNWNTDEVTYDDLLAACSALVYAVLEFPMTQVNGTVVILDMKNLNLSHLKQLTPHYIEIALRLLQECAPLRIKEIHIVNESIILKYLWVIIKHFLSKKMSKRFFFHQNNMESLHQFISPCVLPPEYDGNLDLPGVAEQSKETKFGENLFLDFMNSGYLKEEQKLKDELKD